jgi:hypothetical protein
MDDQIEEAAPEAAPEARTWECGHCTAQTQDTERPDSPCPRCGAVSWGEVLRGEEGFGDAFRPDGGGETA